jgi:XTP/dITP diphosphohydrolase
VRIARLVVASKNPDKIGEIESVLGGLGLVDEIVRDVEWPDVEETGATLEENALLKARAVAHTTNLPALADDTGLEVEALNRAPGVRTGRFAGPNATYHENVDLLLSKLDGREDRSARFRTVMALVVPTGPTFVAEGIVEGHIGEFRRGDSGFGYDPVFVVGSRTLAEMSAEEKNLIGHRGRALRELARKVGAA